MAKWFDDFQGVALNPKTAGSALVDEAAHKSFVYQYLNGYCDGLAIALATYADSPVRSMHPVHVKKSGERVVSRDFLHAYAVVDGEPWDCRGKRAEEAIVADFDRFLALLLKDDDERLEVEFRDYDNARDFIESSGCNPGGGVEALRDAVIPLGLNPDMARMTTRELEQLACSAEENDCDSDFCL
jgi:hypothetical protein